MSRNVVLPETLGPYLHADPPERRSGQDAKNQEIAYDRL